MTLIDICNLADKHGVTISISGEVGIQLMNPVVRIEVKKGDVHSAHMMYVDDFNNPDTVQYVVDHLIYMLTAAVGSVTCELCGNKAPHLVPIFKQEHGEFHKYNVCPECEYKHSQELAVIRENFQRQFGDT